MFSVACSLWGKVSPFGVMRILSEKSCRKFVQVYQTRAQPVDSEEEAAALREYLFLILLRQPSTKVALFQQFDCGLHAHHPLGAPDRLANSDIPFPISIIFGANDWMDSRGSREIVSLNKHFAAGDSNLHIL